MILWKILKEGNEVKGLSKKGKFVLNVVRKKGMVSKCSTTGTYLHMLHSGLEVVDEA